MFFLSNKKINQNNDRAPACARTGRTPAILINIWVGRSARDPPRPTRENEDDENDENDENEDEKDENGTTVTLP